jgi:arylsulfatase A-like enzyme
MSENKVGYLSLALALVFLTGCKSSPKNGFQTVRFIDLLRSENISQSPFGRPAGKQPSPFLEPLKSSPLLGLSPDENPYNLKKKLDLGISVLDILFSPPKSKYSFDITLPPDAVLEFGTGIIRDKNFETLAESLEKEPREVQFIVRLETQDTKKILFQKRLRLPPAQEVRTLEFSMQTVDLPAQPQRARITFLTRGDEGAFSFWHSPVVYTKGRDLRNIILISIDTLRPDHLSCYGYKRKTSPSIDALAQDSVLFEETYASSPWTLPSHVSLFTSLSGISHQVYKSRDRIDPAQTMLTEVLRKNNFFCSAFTGSGYLSSVYGFSKGFDVYGESEGLLTLVNSAELMSQAASKWLGRNADKSFFLFLHTYQVHQPYSCPPPYNTMFLGEKPRWQKINLMNYLGGLSGVFKRLPQEDRQNIIGLYDGEISYVDDMLIKPLIEKLKELRLYDRTMIVLTGDHGEEFFEHGSWMHGQNLYEEALRVPLIIKFPRSKYRGKRISSLVRLIDVMPTVLDELAIDAKNLNVEGKSLIPVIRGKRKKDRILLADTTYFTNRLFPEQRTNSSDMFFPDKITFGSRKNRLILNRELTEEEARSYSPAPRRCPAVELYDLDADSQERVNLASSRADLAKRMVQKIREIYEKQRKAAKNQVQPDKKLEEQLRALGYIH